MKVAFLFPFSLLLGLCGGCTPGTMPVDPDMTVAVDIPPPRVSFSEVLDIVSTPACAKAECHGASTPMPIGRPLLLTREAACSSLREASAFATVPDEFKRRVVPGDRARSFFYRKFIVDPTNVEEAQYFGQRMPLGSTPLDPAQLDTIGAWIDQGAACP